MAENYTPKKMELSDINGGVKYINGQAPDVNDFNEMVEGIAFAQQIGDGVKLYRHTYERYINGSYVYEFGIITKKPTVYTTAVEIAEAFNSGEILKIWNDIFSPWSLGGVVAANHNFDETDTCVLSCIQGTAIKTATFSFVTETWVAQPVEEY